MSRLSRVEVAAREQFVCDLFRNSPSLSGAAVQQALQSQFGKMMRPNRIYELKRQVANEAAASSLLTLVDGPEPELDTEPGSSTPTKTVEVSTQPPVDNQAVNA